MFISKKEKELINNRLKNLEATVRDLSLSIVWMKKANDEKVASSKWSPEMREKQAERMRQRWAKKREGKNG